MQRPNVMLKNLPNKYQSARLVQVLDAAGYSGAFDFVYLPIDFQNRCNVGYAFINFRSQPERLRFGREFDGKPVREVLPGFNSTKVCRVAPARFQGISNNLSRVLCGVTLKSVSVYMLLGNG